MPSHAAINANRHVARFGSLLKHHNLWHLHRRSVAGGVAVGMFAGLIPGSNPVQFSAAALLAIVFRVNLPIAVIVTLYSNPFTIVPLYYLAYKIGGVVLLQGSGDSSYVPLDHEGRTYGEWLPAVMDWLASVGKPLLVGVPLLALMLSVLSYFAVRWGWRCYTVMAWHARQRRRIGNKNGRK